MDNDQGAPPDDDEIVPIFGTWRGIYAAVLLTTIAALVFIGLFSKWSF